MPEGFEIKYELDVSQLSEIIEYVQKKKESQLVAVVKVAGDYLTQEWITTAGGKFKYSQGGYVQGIVDGLEYPFEGDKYHYRITNKAKHALALERGFKSFDMKKALNTSDKVRMTKDGKRYLVIPFQHGTPGSKSIRPMPQEVYNEAKSLRQSLISKTYNEGSIRGARDYEQAEILRQTNNKKVTRLGYIYGGKLKFTGEDPKKDYSIYQGMYRFGKNPVEARKLNLGKFTYKLSNISERTSDRSSYMTFRIMKEDSKGWIHPGIEPMNILGETVERARGPIYQMFGEAARADLGTVFEK
jgi:hypothetical protein